jgi:hypothetical protein
VAHAGALAAQPCNAQHLILHNVPSRRTVPHGLDQAMSEPKTKATAASVEGFLAQQPAARRADCEMLVQLMREATGEPPTMWGASIVGFGRYAQARSDGKSFEWPVVGFSPRKNELTLYLMQSFAGNDDLLVRLGKHRTGKACLYIKRLANVDLAVLRELVAGSVAAMASKRVRSD